MKKKPSFLKMIRLNNDGIWGEVFNFSGQEEEKILRKKIANFKYTDYLSEISKNHSIPVMDRENEKFISLIPKNGVILDIGGCWGWHWRRLHETRPDVTVVIVDFIRENLIHAQNILLVFFYGRCHLLCEGGWTKFSEKSYFILRPPFNACSASSDIIWPVLII